MMNIPKQITRNQLETIRLIMVKRMAANLSAEKLSFLMGCEQNYVSNIEQLEAEPYTIEEIKRVAIALKEKNFKSFFLKVSDDTLVKAMMETEVIGNHRRYTCNVIAPNETKQLSFILQEELPEVTRLIENNDFDGGIASDAIALLIRGGYFFKFRLPVNIYYRINLFLKTTISPTYVQNALNDFCDRDGEFALKRMDRQGKGICYVEA
jgi:transcriptional regulator with XRE-family HTH domain